MQKARFLLDQALAGADMDFLCEPGTEGKEEVVDGCDLCRVAFQSQQLMLVGTVEREK